MDEFKLEETKGEDGPENIIFDDYMKENYDQETPTPSFALKNVMSKFSCIKNGFDNSSCSKG